MASKQSTPRQREAGKNALEWTVFALSGLLIAAMLVVLAREAAGWKNRPPELSVKLGEPAAGENDIAFSVEVTNHGDVAATDVRVELASGGHRGHVTFDFISRHETRRGQVSFPPGGGPPQVVGIGFAEP
jgi:uncharacterized protein (TIGR02588 family)